MNPIYRFNISANGQSFLASPIWSGDLSKDYERNSGEQFFRAKLNGKITFNGNDFMFISAQPFDTQFQLDIYISYDMGVLWTAYWSGTFWKTDCEFDNDTHTITVTPSVLDRYNDILAGLDKEYNLIDLAPEIVPVKADKRPMVQVYVPGQSVIGCFLSGMWWEQECESVRIDETITVGGQEINKLTDYLHFALNKTIRIAEPSGNYSPETGMFIFVDSSGVRIGEFFEATSGDYTLIYEDMGGNATKFSIKRNSDNVVLWELNTGHYGMPPYTVTLAPVTGTDATGNISLYVHELPVFSRFILDTPQISGRDTFPIPTDDIVENNRNYTRVISYYFPDTIYFSTLLTSTPNQWGLYQPGQYYQQPYLYWSPELFPVARNAWGRVSIWFTFSALDLTVEESGREPFTIRHAYPLWSVISVLLEKIAPDIDFRANYRYSEFLYPYDNNPISWYDFKLFITPKSNIVSAGYDQPAQKAPITLRNVFDMLRDCFRCYWFIDDNNHLRIEHIQYFINGGSYIDTPNIGIDLTTQQVPRNGKPWSFGTEKYKFDKPEMAARYQFGWMDDVTALFDGYPIEIISKFVNPENIEQINVSRFTSDIDYILLNPGAVSKDGFVLLGAIPQNGGYALPYYNFVVDGNEHLLQNAYVAFCLLQQYYAYDMPAPNYEINGVQMQAIGVKKTKTQEIRFPVGNDPDLFELVKTNLGNGTIEKLSVNLSSRNANATLKYDTE